MEATKIGRTAFRKIVDPHCVEILPDGSMVLKLDMVWGHEITPPNGILDMQERNCDVVFNPNRIKMMIDHVSPAKDTDSAMQGKCVRDWSLKHSVEFLTLDVMAFAIALFLKRDGFCPVKSALCQIVIPAHTALSALLLRVLARPSGKLLYRRAFGFVRRKKSFV